MASISTRLTKAPVVMRSFASSRSKVLRNRWNLNSANASRTAARTVLWGLSSKAVSSGRTPGMPRSRNWLTACACTSGSLSPSASITSSLASPPFELEQRGSRRAAAEDPTVIQREPDHFECPCAVHCRAGRQEHRGAKLLVREGARESPYRLAARPTTPLCGDCTCSGVTIFWFG